MTLIAINFAALETQAMAFPDTMQLQFLDPTPLVRAPDGKMEPQDIYKAEAARQFGVPYHEVTEEQRDYAKRSLYQLIYSAPTHLL